MGSAQSGGSYEITQSVIASGGGKSDGGTYSITGTVGQPVPGINSSNPPYSATGGFWQAFFAPTAAMVSISGRITTIGGQPISRVSVIVEGPGGLIMSAITNTFGNFHINNIQAGQTYIVSARHRRYEFAPQVISVNDEISGFVMQPLN
ncbi:MAG TPA: carboxypeptidase-like regulatory domain-containing protein [Pyrinomonadaceae bacterium]|nr:carboxypeptidase-like regulatory domain-containing protein [Pyrinomonadaceae bacterium]